MDKKTLRIDIKADGGTPGQFSGRANAYGVLDSYNDIVVAGAFSRYLAEKGNRIKVLNQHNPEDPIGIAELVDTPTALLATGQLELGLQSARDAYTRLKSGLIDGISIGYAIAPGGARYENGRRLLVDLELFEISLVAFPSNDEARVTNVKATGDVTALGASIQRLRDNITSSLSPMDRMDLLVKRLRTLVRG
jgi:hypothetical protein